MGTERIFCQTKIRQEAKENLAKKVAIVGYARPELEFKKYITKETSAKNP